ncbi:hypothetical protein EMA8858_01992 [Emticicia aquatica]|jgi:amino acid transporter|uniref:Uncharacterized protein n=1 Tax=Emticicia aquatica TaxID=1681835 RepID=A0ABM9APV0_9BACT|nr:hypothetical protein [Emticicia aquatica]CAH0995864.1 hypothetical protein EMA8858_01992 [Emticicia aquatica]
MDFIKHFILHIILAITFAVLAFYFPIKKTERKIISPRKFKKISPKYRKWDVFFMVIMVTFLVICTYLLTETFLYIYKITDTHHDAIFNILTARLAWYFPFTLVSMAIYVRLSFQISRFFLRNDFEEYMDYSTQTTYGIDNESLIKPLIWVCLSLSFIGLLWMYDYRSFIYNDYLEYNELSTIGKNKKYVFSDIKKIEFERYYSDEKLLENYKISFADSNYWNIHGGLFYDKNEVIIAQYLSQKSKVKIDTLKIRND